MGTTKIQIRSSICPTPVCHSCHDDAGGTEYDFRNHQQKPIGGIPKRQSDQPKEDKGKHRDLQDRIYGREENHHAIFNPRHPLHASSLSLDPTLF